MGRDIAADVKKHSIATAQQKTGGTETFTHMPSGLSKIGVATRVVFGDANDKVTVEIYQRIPGRSETAADDDYFDAELLSSMTLGGLTSGAGTTFAVDTKGQHIKIIGMYYNNSSEYVMKYRWNVRGSTDSNVLAMISWTQPGGGI